MDPQNPSAGTPDPVKTPDKGVKNTQPAPIEIELAALQTKFDDLAAEKERIEAEKENYRKGMLKAKGKIEDNPEPLEDEDERVRRIIREEQSRSDLARINAEQKKLIDDLTRKAKELSISVANRGTMPPAGGTSAAENVVTPKDDFWSPEQIAALKAKGLDPQKVKENYLKRKESNT